MKNTTFSIPLVTGNRLTHLWSSAILVLLLITNAYAADRQVLHGHVVRAVTELHLQPARTLASSTNLDLAISLPLRNQEALTNLLQQQYSPTSPQYHHWLTPDEFTAKFGPTERNYQAVIDFAKANGFTIAGTHPNRTLVDVRGSVANIERAFRVTLHAYQHPTEAREFYAPDVEPSLDLSVPILHIAGLDNYILLRPISIHLATQNTKAIPTSASGSGPSGSYMGQDFRAAYVPGTSLTGTGQAVALVEFDGYYTSDISQYESQASLPNVTLTNVLVDGATGSPGENESEDALDIETVIAMAPGLSKVIVYEGPQGPTTETDAIDTLNRIATDDLAKQISCSWQLQEAFGATNFDQIYQQYAMQGQSFFQASGDDGAYTSFWPNQQQQADSPYITVVGGTALTTTGPQGAWLSESVWNRNIGTGFGATNGASGGGISTNYTIPSWQQGINMTFNQGSQSARNVPDVAMLADNIYLIHGNGLTVTGEGGTSAAAPLWAGFAALVNQQAVANGQPTVGFVNPAIYEIGTDPVTYAACFHDIIIGNNETFYSSFQFSAASGYDLCTGWGTPTGSNLVNALAPQPQSDLTRENDSLNDLSPPAGGTVTVSITITNQSCPGGGFAAGPFHVGFYWSTDSSFSGVLPFYEAPESGCPNGGSVPITQNVLIDPATTPGTYYLGYRIDDSNEVAECTENDKGIFYWTVTVLPAPVCTFTLSPASVKLPARGGAKTLRVKAKGTSCTWTAASNDPFITITLGASGTGNGIVHYKILGNTNTVPLTGTMTVAGQTVTVTQAAGGCTFKLSPKSAKLSFIGTVAAAKTVRVKANFSDCSWMAVSNDPFITIIGGASGVGNGMVSYTVAENPTNNAPRSGTITIGGDTFTVTESSVLQ